MADPYFEPFQAEQSLRMGEQQMAQSARMFPAQMAHQSALARLADAEAAQRETQVAADKLVAQRMQARMGVAQRGGQQPPNMFDMAQGLAEDGMAFIAAGDPMRGNQLLTTSSQMLSRASTADKNRIEKIKAEAAMQQRQVDDLARLAAGVKSPDDWQRALQWWRQTHEGEQPSEQFRQLVQMPYSPELMKTLVDGATSVKDKINAQLRQLEEQHRERHRRVVEAQGDAKIKQGKQRNQLARDRETRLAKTGGKTQMANVPAFLVNAADDAIRREFPELDVKSKRSEMARVVAAKAAQAMRETPGLDPNAALYKALQEEGQNITEQTQGELSVMGYKIPGTGTTTKAYRGPGATAASPMGLPKTGAAGLVKGMWYKTPKGALYYDGTHFLDAAEMEQSGGGEVADSGDDAEDDE